VLGSLPALSGTAVALGLGEIVQQSSLGEPFRVTIPVIVNAEDLAGDELAPECFRLVASESQRGTELPQIVFGRATLARNARGVFVIVTSNTLANDPAMSFTVQAGCKLRIRHEYTVLLDPPIIREPVADDSTTSIVAGTTAPPRSRAAAQGGNEAPARSVSRARSSGTGKTPAQGRSAPESRPAAKAPAPAAVARAPDDSKPRLTVSRGSDDRSVQGASDISRGKSDEEIRREVEAETVVLQRRIAELSVTLDRMQTELREATAARENAERAAARPAPPPAAWAPGPWLVVLILLVVVLALALMLARSRRMPAFARLDAPTVSGEETVAPSLVQNAGARNGSPVFGAGAAGATVDTHAARSTLQEQDSEEEASFDDDLLRYAEQRRAYTVLEREHPKVVTSVMRDWGKPKVIAYLREILVSPRRASVAFSREAVSDLMLLQRIAMDHAGYGPDDDPWRIQVDALRTGQA
jgi:hypothetical protein